MSDQRKNIKLGLAYLSREELEEILLDFYLFRPKRLEDLIDVWSETSTKIGNAINKHLRKVQNELEKMR